EPAVLRGEAEVLDVESETGWLGVGARDHTRDAQRVRRRPRGDEGVPHHARGVLQVTDRTVDDVGLRGPDEHWDGDGGQESDQDPGGSETHADLQERGVECVVVGANPWVGPRGVRRVLALSLWGNTTALNPNFERS